MSKYWHVYRQAYRRVFTADNVYIALSIGFGISLAAIGIHFRSQETRRLKRDDRFSWTRSEESLKTKSPEESRKEPEAPPPLIY